jgi:hypothetical protein
MPTSTPAPYQSVVERLRAENAELASIVESTKVQADRWRFIANEMGYEPKAHKHDPLPPYLQARIARYREEAAATLLLSQQDRLDKLEAGLARIVEETKYVENSYASAANKIARSTLIEGKG